MQQIREKLDQKFAQLEEYIAEIKNLRKYPKSKFHKTSLVEAGAERLLYKTIQCAIDIAQIIVSEFALGEPSHYKDLFTKLGKKKIISSKLQESLEEMAGFRNVLAHGYARVKPEKVYKYVHKDIDDLISFIKAIQKFLGPVSK